MTVTATPTAPVTETIALTLADTCDQCGYSTDTDRAGHTRYSAISQAYVRVTFPNGHDLLLCGHHYAANELPLATVAGITVTDQRNSINEKAGYSA